MPCDSRGYHLKGPRAGRPSARCMYDMGLAGEGSTIRINGKLHRLQIRANGSPYWQGIDRRSSAKKSKRASKQATKSATPKKRRTIQPKKKRSTRKRASRPKKKRSTSKRATQPKKKRGSRRRRSVTYFNGQSDHLTTRRFAFEPVSPEPRNDSSREAERYWLVAGQYAADADSGVVFYHVLRTEGGVPNGVRFDLEGEEGWSEFHLHGISEIIPDEDAVVFLNEPVSRNPTHEEGVILDTGRGVKELISNDETDGYIIENATEEEIQRLSENGTHRVLQGDGLRTLRHEDTWGASMDEDDDYVRKSSVFANRKRLRILLLCRNPACRQYADAGLNPASSIKQLKFVADIIK